MAMKLSRLALMWRRQPALPEGCELVRSQRYGETIIDFILWKIPEK